jgi:hypothetical protein
MSATNEWWEFHLTKDGWITGSEQLDFGPEKSVPTPPNTLLTRRYKEYASSTFSAVERTYSDRGEKTEEVKSLLRKFPHPRKSFENYSGF